MINLNLNFNLNIKITLILFSLFSFCSANAQYCLSNGKKTSDEYIAKVEFGSIKNASLATKSGYQNFSHLSTKLKKGSTYQIEITPVWANKIYKEGYSVWIDFNRDGDFNDLSEQVWYKNPSTTNTIKGNIRIPNSASTGSTKMRVSMSYKKIPGACEKFSYGEVEDYTVFIEPAVNNDTETIDNPSIDQTAFSAEIAELLALVNNARQSNGLAPLKMVQSLSAAAKSHANDMINNNFFSHTGFNGSNAGERITAQGYSYSAWAENIAYGFLSAQSVFDAWMDSPGHKANILRSTVTEIGQIRVQNHWVQVFARPSGPNRLASNNLTDFTIYPNPATNSYVFINGNYDWAEMSYQLVNTAGAIVKNEVLESNRLDLTGLANGVYAFQLTNSDRNIVAIEKIVVNR